MRNLPVARPQCCQSQLAVRDYHLKLLFYREKGDPTPREKLYEFKVFLSKKFLNLSITLNSTLAALLVSIDAPKGDRMNEYKAELYKLQTQVLSSNNEAFSRVARIELINCEIMLLNAGKLFLGVFLEKGTVQRLQQQENGQRVQPNAEQ